MLNTNTTAEGTAGGDGSGRRNTAGCVGNGRRSTAGSAGAISSGNVLVVVLARGECVLDECANLYDVHAVAGQRPHLLGLELRQHMMWKRYAVDAWQLAWQ